MENLYKLLIIVMALFTVFNIFVTVSVGEQIKQQINDKTTIIMQEIQNK